MKTKIKLVLFLLFLIGSSYQSMATTWYVRTDPFFNPSDNNPGTSFGPNQAWRHIYAAVNNPNVTYGDIILVANDGIYSENITWPSLDGITLQGVDIMGSGANPIIDGNQLGSVINITSYGMTITNATVIDGFDITNGLSVLGGATNGNGGGIYMAGLVAPTLVNLNIKSNECRLYGGGIYYHPAIFYTQGVCNSWGPSYLTCKMINVVVKNNYALNILNPVCSGGGIYIEGDIQNAVVTCPEINTEFNIMYMDGVYIFRNRCDLNGGGICIIHAKISLNNVKINDVNSAGNNGGGLYSSFSVTELADVEIKNNETALDGGGAYLTGGLNAFGSPCHDCVFFPGIEHHWINVDISGNHASRNGGGLYVDGVNLLSKDKYLDLIYRGSFICQNSADNNGGGIYVYSAASLYLTDLTIIGNNAITGDGGAIYNYCEYNPNTGDGWTPEHYFEQLLIIQNQAAGLGGGIYTRQTFYCINSTISDNYGATNGGAVACLSYNTPTLPPAIRPVFYNSILWRNTYYNGIMTTPNQVYLDDNTCDPQFAYCDIEGFSVLSPPHDFRGNGNLNWVDYGWNPAAPAILDSYPFTIPFVDYHIPNNSPCKDAGNTFLNQCLGWPGFCSFTPFPWLYDLDWNSRVCQTSIDMGVYEVCVKSEPIGSVSNNSVSGLYNVSIQPNPWQTGEVLEMTIFSLENSLLSISIIDNLGRTFNVNQVEIKGEQKVLYAETTNSLMPGLYIMHFTFQDEKGKTSYIDKKIIKI
ncbi:MAG: hypothetical protein NTU44_15115 [Bacteroidetes bacterium]|nr:hypothetical protein [Bacteroidota bacterium]